MATELLVSSSQQYSSNCSSSFSKIANENKICVTNSHNQIFDGQYEFQSYNVYLNGSVYHHITEHKYFSGVFTTENQEYYIHSYESDNITIAKCVISKDDAFQSCIGKWTVYYNNSWHFDANMISVPCQDRCIKHNSKSWINNGVFEWINFNTTRLSSIYYCSECIIAPYNGTYLYGWIYESGIYDWRIGPDSNGPSAWVHCQVGNASGSDYIFKFEDCNSWNTWNSSISEWFLDGTTADLCGTQLTQESKVYIDGADNEVLNGEYWWLYYDMDRNGSVYYNVNNETFIYPFISDLGNYYWQIGIDADTSARCKLPNNSFNFDDCMGNWEVYLDGEWIGNQDIFFTGCPNLTAEFVAEIDGIFDIGLIALILCIVFIVCKVGIRRNKRRKQRKHSVTWDTLCDLNAIRSNFKSSQSLQVYLSGQSCSMEMFVSIAFLVAAIFINTFTNLHSFWHYRNVHFVETFQSIILGSGGVVLMAVIEFLLSCTMILYSLVMYIFKYYDNSVFLMIGIVPNMSALIYFTFLNTNVAKRVICQAWYSKKTFRGKMCNIITWLLVLSLGASIGIWVFVVKIEEISYIYSREIGTLGWADFIAVVGIARQFAGLCNYGQVPYYGFAFSTMHPAKAKERTEKHNIDKIICREMVTKHGLWGYCWLCYTFNDRNNVKKLYLENHDEQQFISMGDPTQYIQMVDQ